MKTAAQIDTTAVTGEMVGRAHKDITIDGNSYLVESSRDLFTADGSRVEYRVSWSKERGFSCTCDAGMEGFAHCKAGVCQHVIIAVACEREVRSELARMSARIDQERAAAERATLVIDGRPATAEEWNRVMNAQPAPIDPRAKPIVRGPFSLLR